MLVVISWSIIIFFGLISPQHYSEESIVNATIDDKLFGGLWETHAHVAKRFFNDSLFATMKQEERLDAIFGTLNATITVMQALDLPVFLDSGTLLGWFRHNGSIIPWDIDGDVGTLAEECIRKYPDQLYLEKKIGELLPPPYELEYWDCHTRPDLGRTFIGYISDSRNGFKVDIFGYSAVDSSKDKFSWRKKSSWLQRDLDRNQTHRVVPRAAILPLQWGNFSGITGDIIPNDPKRALQWDFGFVLEPPILPHGIALKVELSTATLILLIILLFSSFRVILAMQACASFLLLGGGIRVVALLLVVAQYRPRGNFLVWGLRGALLLMLISDLFPLVPEVFTGSMEALGISGYTVNPGRYCFLYKVICIEM